MCHAVLKEEIRSERKKNKSNSDLVHRRVLQCDRLLNRTGELLTRTSDPHHPAKHCPSVPVSC